MADINKEREKIAEYIQYRNDHPQETVDEDFSYLLDADTHYPEELVLPAPFAVSVVKELTKKLDYYTTVLSVYKTGQITEFKESCAAIASAVMTSTVKENIQKAAVTLIEATYPYHAAAMENLSDKYHLLPITTTEDGIDIDPSEVVTDEKTGNATIQLTENELERAERKLLENAWAEVAMVKLKLEDLAPQIAALNKLLIEAIKLPVYEGKSLSELFSEVITTEAKGLYISMNKGSRWEAAVYAVEEERKRRLEEEKKAKEEAQKRAKVKGADKVTYPIDKLNNKAFHLTEEQARNEIMFNYAKKGAAPARVSYSIDVETLQKLGYEIPGPFDKRVMVALYALIDSNIEGMPFSLTQIHEEMGRTTKPNRAQREKILASVKKMLSTPISIDNKELATQWGQSKYYTYTGALLPCEIIEERTVKSKLNSKKGDLLETYILPLRRPPFIELASTVGQITTIEPKMLQSGVTGTATNYAIEDYLIFRYSQAKRSKRKTEKIEYATLFENAGIGAVPKVKKEKDRKLKPVFEYLDYYKKEKYIKGYTADSESVTLLL